MQYPGPDPWILLSIIYPGRERGGATLHNIIAAADGLIHAVPTHGELDGALARLFAAGHAVRDGATFRVSEPMRAAHAARNRTGGMVRHEMDEVQRILGALPWTPSYRPPIIGAGDVVPREEYDAAVESYVGRPRRRPTA